MQPTKKAAVIGNVDYTMCGGGGGWFVQVGSAGYQAEIAAPYNKENKSVWIRFKKNESDGNKINGRWIVISSIRDRE
ncbi:hypothetical protein [Dyadobacter frigoris]|uniref:Uncharacterized protein n=1 Tax=Dyadobacter frigoris TaxID=2576211 RepID=A0A4U6CSI8_9BACT|nr:hypothetical protein [Dyadobacter frigoris]TKT87569.1 hypothetical protein FDK13_28635 [Dyadobacter frigoris]